MNGTIGSLQANSSHVLVLTQSQRGEHAHEYTQQCVHQPRTSRAQPTPFWGEDRPSVHSWGRPGFPSKVQTSLLGAFKTSSLNGYLTGVGFGTKKPQSQEGEKERELVRVSTEGEGTTLHHPDPWTLMMKGGSVAPRQHGERSLESDLPLISWMTLNKIFGCPGPHHSG